MTPFKPAYDSGLDGTFLQGPTSGGSELHYPIPVAGLLKSSCDDRGISGFGNVDTSFEFKFVSELESNGASNEVPFGLFSPVSSTPLRTRIAE
jgi:hypothetical protein